MRTKSPDMETRADIGGLSHLLMTIPPSTRYCVTIWRHAPANFQNRLADTCLYPFSIRQIISYVKPAYWTKWLALCTGKYRTQTLARFENFNFWQLASTVGVHEIIMKGAERNTVIGWSVEALCISRGEYEHWVWLITSVPRIVNASKRNAREKLYHETRWYGG